MSDYELPKPQDAGGFSTNANGQNNNFSGSTSNLNLPKLKRVLKVIGSTVLALGIAVGGGVALSQFPQPQGPNSVSVPPGNPGQNQNPQVVTQNIVAVANPNTASNPPATSNSNTGAVSGVIPNTATDPAAAQSTPPGNTTTTATINSSSPAANPDTSSSTNPSVAANSDPGNATTNVPNPDSDPVPAPTSETANTAAGNGPARNVNRQNAVAGPGQVQGGAVRGRAGNGNGSGSGR